MMVKFYESHFSYDYSFPAVTLAYFLRYPNPYSRHVLSTDVIDRYVDPHTSRLHTIRLHLKRSKVPATVLKLLPKTVLGAMSSSTGQSYILEKSVVDVKEGWMRTESKNLEWTGVLSVIERQVYSKPVQAQSPAVEHGGKLGGVSQTIDVDGWTDVRTTVTFHSRLGQGRAAKPKIQHSERSGHLIEALDDEEEVPAKKGLFASWSTSSIQRSIELIGLRRTRDHLSKSTEGMKLVLERLRGGGLVGVLDEMKKDREAAFGGDRPWRRAWQKSAIGRDDGDAQIDNQDGRREAHPPEVVDEAECFTRASPEFEN